MPASRVRHDRREADPAALIFRRSAGRILASLTRLLGPERLTLGEDAVQEALLRALQTWPYHGIPDNPEGWLYRVARNRALDEVRSSQSLARRLRAAAFEPVDGPENEGAASPFRDDDLAMMFLCCHPRLSPSLQVCLTLKAVAGFGVDEIAAAFLARRSTIQQRLVRAKRVLREEAVPFAMPDVSEIGKRLDSVLRVLYLLFNEGYGASAGETATRAELCGEAIRLATSLVGHPRVDRPVAHALLALMHFQASRLAARSDGSGALVLLEEQDRSSWDRRAIAAGLRHLERAATGDELTAYHLEAGIAVCHAVAAGVEETDWARIVELYDVLLALRPTPVVRLNRAVAIAALRGAEAGLAEIDGLERHPSMSRYHLLPAVRGRLLERAGSWSEAATEYARAADLCRTGPDRALLERRLAAARERA